MQFLVLFVAFVNLFAISFAYICYRNNGGYDNNNNNLVIVDCNEVVPERYQNNHNQYNGHGCNQYRGWNRVRFSNCPMPLLPVRAFKDIRSEVIISVDISKLDGEALMHDYFSDLIHLEKLHANNNKLETLPERIFSNTKLNYLDVSNNRIAQIETIGKCGANDLQTLLLSNNTITTINGTTFHYLRRLTILDLSFNALQTLAHESFDELLDLNKLSLAHANLFHFDFGMLSRCNNLKSLNISGNHIAKIDIGLHSTLFRVLNRIDMNFSEISEIDGLIPSIFPALVDLNLQNNRFNCSHLQSIVKSFDMQTLMLTTDQNTKIQKGMAIRGVSCIQDDVPASVPPERKGIRTTFKPSPIIRRFQMPDRPINSNAAANETAKHGNCSVEKSADDYFKNAQIVSQRMYEVMITVLILVVIIMIIIILIFGTILYLNKIQLFSQFRQNQIVLQLRRSFSSQNDD